MNLAFSTKFHKANGLGEFIKIADELRYDGIEIHDIKAEAFSGKSSPFNPDMASVTKRTLINAKKSIVCINVGCNVADKENAAENMQKIETAVSVANNINVPHIKVFAESADESAFDFVTDFMSKVIALCEKKNVVVLVETSGIFADTNKLCDLLNFFASDYIGADWNMYETFFHAKEDAETTIKNLGAYVKLVHMTDAVAYGEHTLIGEGKLPVEDMVNALRSINFAGFVCVEWDPEWLSEIDDLEIILTHYESFVEAMGSTKSGKKYFYNKTRTGKFVWEKEELIEKTFSQVLDTMVENFPDQLAFKYTTLDYTRTYSEFRDDVDNFARALIAMGVKAGTHVAVWATNVPQWYIAFWAATKIGAVLVTVNTAYKIHEAEYLFRQSDTHTLIMVQGYRDSHYDEIVAELCPELKNTKSGEQLHAKRLPFLRNVITVGYEQEGCMTWNEALEKASQVPVEEVYRMASLVKKDDVCNMQYTSGTTGFPKGVMLTHYNVVNNGKCIGDRMDLSTADRMMIQVPMFHCFGMVLAMTATMTHGGTILPLPYFSPKPSLACINNERITAFHGVPTMFIAMLQHPDFEKTDFSYMRTGIMAGSPCPIAKMREVVEKMNMKEITIVYGQTEASPGCTMSSTEDPLELRVATVGKALPKIECKVVDPETGLECPPDVNGEFVARGYNIMKGYYKMPKATAEAIDKDGWLHTGDLACKTVDGYYKITGRLKDMIIRGGENIYPKEIEEFIYTHEKVKDVQVIGVPDEGLGEEIMACIILHEGEEMTEGEMRQYVLDHMAKHKVPKYIDFVKEFPMNAAGKILKYKMREMAIEKYGLQKANAVVTA
ncbi:MAG: AMP-binding protein [Clostridia bacterium]|nr:AMP-binding protein [Clostridia bacterium]